MKKKYWIALAVYVGCVIAAAVSLRADEMWLMLLLLVVPFIAISKSKIAIRICGVLVAGFGLFLFSVGVDQYTFDIWLPFLELFIFGTLITVWTYCPVKLWILYIAAAINVVLGVSDILEMTIGGHPIPEMMDWYRWQVQRLCSYTLIETILPALIQVMTVYILTHHDFDGTILQERLQRVLGKPKFTYPEKDMTGYTYLEEYKKNMRK
ncbi:MAG: hypothetical protein IKK75_03095 [Clostridia bacterium]|nr:hypothetical protein [Clostridia bacterium]